VEENQGRVQEGKTHREDEDEDEVGGVAEGVQLLPEGT